MILISSSQALDMLSAHAPRAWGKRVLSWQINVGAIELYFTAGAIVERRYSFIMLHQAELEEGTDVLSGLIKEYGEELGRSVNAALPGGYVDVRVDRWENEARPFPVEMIVFADELDWEEGTLSVNWHDQYPRWAGEYEHLYFDREEDDLDIDLRGMCFGLESIEMLAPNGQIPKRDDQPSLFHKAVEQQARGGGPGRRREHDWEGALFHLIGEAEKNSIAPDPDAHGAQADIKRRLADWFSLNGGKVPADSQLQTFAARALNSIRKASP